MSRKLKFRGESREIIQSKLLGSLNDEAKVAIILNEKDCQLLLKCLNAARGCDEARESWKWADVFCNDLDKLIGEAFNGRSSPN